MNDLRETYKTLTGVDIDEQRRIWDERGKGYYGEYLVLEHLYHNVEGKSKILMNLNIPVAGDKTTEIDLALIHETGIYLFEMKHYKGTIYGDPDRESWTQYFKTTENQSFKNPIRQNEYHRTALCRQLPDVPIYSYIVFTNRDVKLKVLSPVGRSVVVSTLADLNEQLNIDFGSRRHLLSGEEIEKIFSTLSAYSPRMERKVDVENIESIPISAYLEMLRQSDQRQKRTLGLRQANSPKKGYLIGIIACLALLVAVLLFAGLDTTNKYKEAQGRLEQVEQELESLKDTSLPVDITQQIIVSNVQLQAAESDTSTFSAYLSSAGTTYGFILNEDTQYYIQLKNGSIKVIDIFGERLVYSASANKFSPKGSGGVTGGQLVPLKLSNAVEDIEAIYVSNITLWRNYNGKEYYYNGNSLRVY